MNNTQKKKREGNLNNTLISVFALLISAISLCFSVYSYKESQVERLNIIANSFINENYQTKISLIGHRVVIPIYWDMLLINNSEKTISITDFNVKSNRKDEADISSYFEKYILSNIEDFDKNKLNLPIILNSGESLKIYIRFSVLCGKEASLVLEKKNGLASAQLKKGKLINIDDIQSQLAEKEIDLFDNKIKTNRNDRISSMEIEIINRPEFKISFITGKGGVFEKYGELYIGMKNNE